MVTRQIDVEVGTSTWVGRTAPSSLTSLVGTQDVNILEVLTHVALRTSPPVSYGFSLGDMWAWFRYLPAISNNQELRLREEWADVDPHQKTILSDDWGMGISSVFLSKALDLVAVAPTNYVVNSTGLVSLGVGGGKRGPRKSPDFIGLDRSGRFHVFECKGTQSNRQALAEQFAKGRLQKKNINDPHSLIGESLVSGAFVPQHPSLERPLFRIEDPDGEIDLTNYSPDDLKIRIILGELASSIHLLGFPHLANAVAANQVLSDDLKERIKQEIGTSLEEITFGGHSYKSVRTMHWFDYPDLKIDGATVLGVRVEIGFSDKLLSKILEEEDYDSLAVELTQPQYELNNWDPSSNGRAFDIVTPLGLHFHLSLEV